MNPDLEKIFKDSKSCGGVTLKQNHDEDILQEHFAIWLNQEGLLFTASCAGMRTTMAVGAKMKRMGAKSGFPDIQICEPTRKYHGLFIELRSEKGTPSNDQKAWRDELNRKGYYSAIMPKGLDFAVGLEWCKKLVRDYLNGKL